MDRSVIIEQTGPSQGIVDVTLLNGKGESINSSSFSMALPRGTISKIETSEKLTPETKLKITLGDKAHIAEIPFKFENQPIPGAGLPEPGTRGPTVAAAPEKLAWTTNLSQMKIPNAPASGRLHGQIFRVTKAEISHGTLTLAEGEDFIPDKSVELSLFLDVSERPAGKKFWIPPGQQQFDAPHVHIRWPKEGNTPGGIDAFMDKYALVLTFGEPQDGRLPGMIYLCLPDDSKSVVAGVFSAEMSD